MKKYLLPSLKLSFLVMILCCVVYFGLVSLIGRLAPGGGSGEKLIANERVVGYERIGQRFTADRYFQGRPSAVEYNAAGSGGSNKGPANPDYLGTVSARIDSFLLHNPGVDRSQIPSDLVTASGSGLDPEISPAGALIQVKRVAAVRGLADHTVRELVHRNIRHNPIGPDGVHVLKLNIALDALSK